MSRQQEPPRGRSSGRPDAWVAPTVPLGQTGLAVSRLGFGCSQINSLSSRHSHGEICDTILEAVDRGINLFDTADVYGQGDSERLLGRLLAGRGDEIVLCTKVGQTVGPAQHLVRLAKPLVRPILRRREARRQRVVQARRRAERKCFAPEYLVARIVASLRRLRRDCADVVLLHSPPPEPWRSLPVPSVR